MLALDIASIPMVTIPLAVGLWLMSIASTDYGWPANSLTTEKCTHDQIDLIFFKLDLPWTAKCTDSFCKQAKDKKQLSYDYVIVGAGASGSLLAYRLALANPSRTVVLIEAGGDPLTQSVPPRLFISVTNTSANFNYYALNNSRASQAFKKGSNANSGKCLGGSTTMSSMTQTCGSDKNFNDWAEIVGDSSWNYANMKTYIAKHETTTDSKLKSGSCASFHGTSGPVKVGDAGSEDWFNATLTNAFKDRNYSEIDDINCGGPYTGYSNVRMYVNKGERVTSASACLTKLNATKNFYLLKNTQVTRVIATKVLGVVTVTGVNVRSEESDCKEFQIFARREVILAAGAQNTPKILLQSGFGHSADLCPDVTQMSSLDVGRNYFDTAATVHFFAVPETNNSADMQTLNVSASLSLEGLRYLSERKGFYSYLAGWNLMAFVNVTNNSSPYPNIIYKFGRFDQVTPDLETTLKDRYGFKDEFVSQIVEVNKKHSVLIVLNSLQNPQSRGTVKLANCSDPLAAPAINASILSVASDAEILLKGMDELYALMSTTTMRNYGVKDLLINITECNQFARYSDDFNRCYLKYFSTGERNFAGTAKMGKESDYEAVVDTKLKVMGVTKTPLTANLRVVDASVIPTPILGDITCPVYAIAEKAADLIIADNFL